MQGKNKIFLKEIIFCDNSNNNNKYLLEGLLHARSYPQDTHIFKYTYKEHSALINKE